MNLPAGGSMIEFDDFLKVDIRAGLITKAERVPKSDKLLKLVVDFGELGIRQVLAGIGLNHDPQAVVDRVAAFIVNLKPRKMMNLESQAMILATEAKNASGETSVVVVWLPTTVVSGARIG